MTAVEIFAWLVLAFAEGPDCLLQASLHWLPNGPALVREDGCAVHSQQEGSHSCFGPTPGGSPSGFQMEHGRYPTGGGGQWRS